MANKKITELNAATSLAATDVVPVVDVSADETKKITATNLFRTLPDGTAAAPSLSFASDAANGLFLASSDTVGIATGGTQRVTVDGSGNVTISGDLQVNGATTTVQSTTVTIDDKNLELGSVATPTDTTANGGGITLKGATDKTINWVQSTGYWTFNTGIEVGGHLQIDDSNEIRVGTGQDLKIYHDGSNSYIADTGTGNLFIRANSQLVLESNNGENYLAANENGDVHLYYDGGIRISTKSDGANVVGELECDSLDVDGNIDIHATRISYSTSNEALKFLDGIKSVYGNGDDLQIHHDGTHSRINDNGSGSLLLQSNGSSIQLNKGTSENMLVANTDGAVDIYYDGSKKLATKSDGIDVTGEVQCDSLDVDGNADITGDVSISGGNKTVQTTAGFLQVGTSSTNHLAFITDGSERGRVDSVGRLLLGTTDEGHADADNFTVADGAHCGITIRSGTTSDGAVYFSDGITGNAEYRGYLLYDHNDDGLRFGTGAVERLRIDSSGRVLINATAAANANTFLTVQNSSGDAQVTINSGPTSESVLNMGDTGDFNIGAIRYNQTDNAFRFFTNNAEQVRIQSDGTVKIGTGTGNPILMLNASTSGTSVIQMGDSADNNIGQIQYANSDDSMRFFANNSERFRITSTGAFAIQGASNYGTSGQVLTSNGNGAPTWQDAGQAAIGGSNAISMNDGVKINFGTDNDLEIEHTGSGSFIRTSTSSAGDLAIESRGTNHDLYLTAADDIFIRPQGGEDGIKVLGNGTVELYYDNGKRLETVTNGVSVTGNVDLSGELNMMGSADGAKYLDVRLGSDTFNIRGTSGGDANHETLATFTRNGPVKLFYDNSQKLQTKTDGVLITGELECNTLDVNGVANFSATPVFQSNIGVGNTTVGNSFANGKAIAFGDNDTGIRQAGDGILEFWANNQERLTIHHNGTTYSRNHFVPHNNNSVDLGGTNNRWRNVYTNDLNLSNEGSSNDVDGTWGSYTIQEGEDDLFLINRRNGKKYKFNLTEVS